MGTLFALKLAIGTTAVFFAARRRERLLRQFEAQVEGLLREKVRRRIDALDSSLHLRERVQTRAIDPFSVPLERKLDLLFRVDEALRRVKGVSIAEGFLTFVRKRQLFLSSEGSEIDQTTTRSGGQVIVTAERIGVATLDDTGEIDCDIQIAPVIAEMVGCEACRTN